MTRLVDGGAGYRVTLRRVVRSEWTKLHSLRSTWFTIGGAALLIVGLAGLIGAIVDRNRDTSPSVSQAIDSAFIAIDVMALVVGVLGVLMMSGEYGSGLIQATLTAVPRRLPVLWAKAMALVAATAPLMIVACFASFLANQAFVNAGDRIAVGDSEVIRAIFGAAAAPVALGLLGLGIGTMLRHTAGAITTYVAVVLIIPRVLASVLPESLQDNIIPYLPIVATQAIYAVGNDGPFPVLAPGPSAIVVLGWVLLMLAGAAAVLHRRDA